MTADEHGEHPPSVLDLVDRLDEHAVRRLLADVAGRDEETARAVWLAAAAGPSELLVV